MKALLSRVERPLLIVALVLGLATASIARAATFPNLYRVTVMPDPTAADQRGAAIQAAMAKLLIRVTGNLAAPLDPALQDMLADASSYLSSYGSDLKGQAQVGFFPARVEQALTARNLPVWGPERPLTLLWIAVDDGIGGRALLSANGTADEGAEPSPEMSTLVEQLRTELLAVADERGIPVTFPLLDLEDLDTVTFADVWRWRLLGMAPTRSSSAGCGRGCSEPRSNGCYAAVTSGESWPG